MPQFIPTTMHKQFVTRPADGPMKEHNHTLCIFPNGKGGFHLQWVRTAKISNAQAMEV